jgi:ClpP class serine protease
MTNAALLASRYARRPLLFEPMAAEELANRVRAVDARAFERPGRLEAFLRRVGLAGSAGRPPGGVMAMEDDDWAPPPPIEQRLAYAPLWAGDVEDTGYCWSLLEGVALMCADTPLVERGEDFCGVVYHGYDTLKAGIGDAMADDRVKAIFLRLSSPGGVVSGGLPDLAAFMRETRATGNAGGKPIWVYADMACSAAYWIAAQADRVLAPGVGLVGSIGAVIVHENYAGALEKAGVEVVSIQFGANKTDGAWWKALSPAAIASLTKEIDQCGRDFCADVAAGRPKLTVDALIATQAQVFMAKHDEDDVSGLALGFVDAIASEEEAFEALLAETSAPKAEQARVQPREEAAMANPNRATRRAAAAKARKAASAAPEADGAAAAAPDPGYVDCETCSGTGLMADGTPCADCDGEGQVADPSGDPNEMPADDKQAAENAAAIAASPEATSHPHLALAAIKSGQSLPQLQATIAALASSPKASRVESYAPHAPRLGPDAPAAAAPAASLSATSIYAKRAEVVVTTRR